MPRGSVILYNSSAQFAQSVAPQLVPTFTTATGSSLGPMVTWVGGRSCVAVDGQNFPTGLQVLVQMPDGTMVQVGSSIVPGTGIIPPMYFSCDLPPGQFQLVAGPGSSVGLYATILPVNYGS
jgi:hypothetical protein